MSKKERDWFRVLERVKKKEITLRQAAQIMDGSYRQCLRRNKRYGQEGAKGLVHRGRGQGSNRAKDGGVRRGIIDRYQERYGDFGPTLAAEKLAKEGHEVDHETLRRWLIKEKLWKKRRKRSPHRSWRERGAHFGEVGQKGGAPHKGFEEGGERCCLLNMGDDGNGETLGALDEQGKA